MRRVLLINQESVPHYRVPVYSHLCQHLLNRGFHLTVVANAIEGGTTEQVDFDFRPLRLGFISLVRLVTVLRPDAVVFWVNLRHRYLFPLLLLTKFSGIRVIYWGHGRDLLDKNSIVKNSLYAAQHYLSDAIILYGEHLTQFVAGPFRTRVFIANNTLKLPDEPPETPSKRAVLARYGVSTGKNIVCIGRLERRKKLDHLIAAFRQLGDGDYGLILVGPDVDGSGERVCGPNVFKLGPVYGDERLRLLRACDVFCLPGHIGLSIVDAMYCGLPVVTEAVDHAPEIMYLKNGVNGYIVPKGDILQLTACLRNLLDDDELRLRFSEAAKREIASNGSIERMCKGFSNALIFACGRER